MLKDGYLNTYYTFTIITIFYLNYYTSLDFHPILNPSIKANLKKSLALKLILKFYKEFTLTTYFYK